MLLQSLISTRLYPVQSEGTLESFGLFRDEVDRAWHGYGWPDSRMGAPDSREGFEVEEHCISPAGGGGPVRLSARWSFIT